MQKRLPRVQPGCISDKFIQQAFSCFQFGRRQADYCSIGWGWFVLFCLLPVFYAVSDKILSFLFCFSSFIITFA
ncbi:hypothetical protein, partial [Bacteroides stercoris]|uniref:hypothetical protein n=1 Tax=Bacteroides stercoris TaxID=46506 RepID=UPI001961BDDB